MKWTNFHAEKSKAYVGELEGKDGPVTGRHICVRSTLVLVFSSSFPSTVDLGPGEIALSPFALLPVWVAASGRAAQF